MASTVAAWPMAVLREVLVSIDRAETPIAGESYRTIGVKWWGEGVYERDTIDGSQTQYNTLRRIHTGDVIINKIWARHGSVAVVQPDLDGCYASGEFPTWIANRDKLEPRWMHWLSKTRGFWEQCDEKSRGTSGKNRIRPERFLEIEIPLPPLDEQRRIVARIEALAARIAEARGLRQAALDLGNQLCRSILFSDSVSKTLTPMHELATRRMPDVAVDKSGSYHFAGVYSFGRGVFCGQVRQGDEFAYNVLTRIHTGDFVYPKLMAWEGALGIVPPACDGLVVSPEFPVFTVNEDRVLPEVLEVYFQMPEIWPSLSGSSTGTNVRRRRLQPSEFLAISFPLPPMDVQHRLRDVLARLRLARIEQEEMAAELDALLPSALDRAFRGQL